MSESSKIYGHHIVKREYLAVGQAVQPTSRLWKSLSMFSSRIAGLSLILALYGLHSPTAQGVMPPEVYTQARNQSPIHALVEVLELDGPTKVRGECTISGKVTRVFRDTKNQLTPDSEIEFTLPCYYSDWNMPVGGTLWHSYKQLKTAKKLEVFLKPTPQPKRFIVPGDQGYIREQDTITPLCDDQDTSIYCR